ncbi:MAG: hypothetical protein ACTSX9_08250 [Candidatus Njordarchaeales archaeon]
MGGVLLILCGTGYLFTSTMNIGKFSLAFEVNKAAYRNTSIHVIFYPTYSEMVVQTFTQQPESKILMFLPFYIKSKGCHVIWSKANGTITYRVVKSYGSILFIRGSVMTKCHFEGNIYNRVGSSYIVYIPIGTIPLTREQAERILPEESKENLFATNDLPLTVEVEIPAEHVILSISPSNVKGVYIDLSNNLAVYSWSFNTIPLYDVYISYTRPTESLWMSLSLAIGSIMASIGGSIIIQKTLHRMRT